MPAEANPRIRSLQDGLEVLNELRPGRLLQGVRKVRQVGHGAFCEFDPLLHRPGEERRQERDEQTHNTRQVQDHGRARQAWVEQRRRGRGLGQRLLELVVGKLAHVREVVGRDQAHELTAFLRPHVGDCHVDLARVDEEVAKLGDGDRLHHGLVVNRGGPDAGAEVPARQRDENNLRGREELPELVRVWRRREDRSIIPLSTCKSQLDGGCRVLNDLLALALAPLNDLL
mmetsp:Transcript_99064/g.284807  ORF Transcript_99064/g.284807 Transcript_99064/m.284807 type:complete len:229 (+) Transcript_99064:97-783(+)